MPTLIPNSNSEDNRPLVEYNKCHGKDDGRFCSDTGVGASTRPKPIRVSSLEEAVSLILQGKVVELRDTASVSTVLEKLASIANEAKRLGKAAPNYDLCNVTVPRTNLFCGSKLRTTEFPNGVPRLEMPQLAGVPTPGSKADTLPRRAAGSDEVNASAQFIAHLKGMGITTTPGAVPASHLKASQAELVGPKVAGMMSRKGYDPANTPIFVSRDNYIVDGHHRWAAIVGRDAADGHLGDLKMRVLKIDAPIAEVLKLANTFVTAFGIPPVAGPNSKRNSKRKS